MHAVKDARVQDELLSMSGTILADSQKMRTEKDVEVLKLKYGIRF